MTLHTIFGEPRPPFSVDMAPDTRATTLVVQSEGPPETATHFWVNGTAHEKRSSRDDPVLSAAV